MKIKKAGTLKKKFIKPEMLDKVGIIAISQDRRRKFWYHVHDNENLPTSGFDIAIHVRL